jgi:hypothetical protein
MNRAFLNVVLLVALLLAKQSVSAETPPLLPATLPQQSEVARDAAGRLVQHSTA